MTNQQLNRYLAEQMGYEFVTHRQYQQLNVKDSNSIWYNSKDLDFHDYPGCFGYLVPYLVTQDVSIQIRTQAGGYFQADLRSAINGNIGQFVNSELSICQAIAQAAEQYFKEREDVR